MRQFLKFFTASCLGTLVALGLVIAVFMFIGFAASLGSAVTVRQNSVLEVKLDMVVPEKTNNVQSTPITLERKNILGLTDIKKQILRAAEDDRIKGIYLDPTFAQLNPASAAELMHVLREFRSSGKFILAYCDYMSQGAYYLASVADTVMINPIGSIDFRGFAAYVPFFKDLLDKTGLKMQIYYAGRFKSATEPFRRNDMSPENKLQTREYLSDTYANFLADIAENRNLPEERVYQIADRMLAGNAEDAADLGLIDVIGYRDEADRWMQRRLGKKLDGKPELLSLHDYYLTDNSSLGTANERIAIVYAEGGIEHSDRKYGVIADKNYADIIGRIRKSSRIKAVVLRVNSPGGSILASENILREVQLLRQAGKPVVISMGDFAASGGYYISCSADSIFAEESTLTGSIGVFSLVPNPHELLDDKIGVQFDTVRTGRYSASFSPFFAWSKEEDQFFQERTDEYYRLFLEKVADGRGMTIDEVDKIAQGRVWTGKRAVDNGLVDGIGNLDRAIASAAALAGLEEYRITEYPRVPDPFNRLITEVLEQGASAATDRYISAKLRERVPHFDHFVGLLKAEEPVARLPVVLDY